MPVYSTGAVHIDQAISGKPIKKAAKKVAVKKSTKKKSKK